MKYYCGLLLLVIIGIFQPSFANTSSKSASLNSRSGLIVNFWNELGFRPGIVLGADWEFKNNQGHGVAVTFPNFVFFVFPSNFFSMSLYPTLSYRYVDPKNGFFTGLSMGVGLNAQWKIVPVFNLDGQQIKDPGFYRMIAVAQWDIGYDFETVLKKPVRLFLSLGWNGLAPNNLNINNHIMIQLGVNIKLADLTRKGGNNE